MKATNGKIAIIDIGSNSVRLRLSEGDAVIFRESIATQLARGMKDGFLCDESVERTFLGLDKLFEISNENGAQILAFATAAVRNSKTGNDFCAKFVCRYNCELDVLSGEDEAEMGILGALEGADGCVIDVGGASSELVFAKNGTILYAYSMPLGAVSLTDLCEKDFEMAKSVVGAKINDFPPLPKGLFSAYSIGGTSNNVAFIMSKEPVFNRDKTSGFVLNVSQMEELITTLYALTPEQIVEKYHVKKMRSRVIHSGALILYSLFNFIGAKQVVMTENDNLEGYFLAKTKGIRYEKQKN